MYQLVEYPQNTYDAKTDEFEEPAHPIGWHDEGDVGIQGKTKLNQLISELSAVDEGECESCAV